MVEGCFALSGASSVCDCSHLNYSRDIDAWSSEKKLWQSDIADCRVYFYPNAMQQLQVLAAEEEFGSMQVSGNLNILFWKRVQSVDSHIC